MKKICVRRIIAFICIFTCCTLFGTACNVFEKTVPNAGKEPVTRQGFFFNTVVTLSLYDEEVDERILDQCMELCGEYESILSRTRTDSEVYAINEQTANTTQDEITLEVSDTVREMVEAGIYYGELSGGGFDITIGAVSRLWDFTSDEPTVPSQQDIENGVSKVDVNACWLEGNMLTLKKGMALDFGGIAKGYVADKLKAYLQESGVCHAVINLGGNILLLGGKTDSEPFTIGIQKPFGAQNETLGAVEVENISVVSSGVYERYFEMDGIRYHHILNPRTGMPYENNVLGVTVLSPTSMAGDGLSTTCFALGIQEGIRLVESLENVEVMYVAQDGKQYFSSGFEQYLGKDK